MFDIFPVMLGGMTDSPLSTSLLKDELFYT